LIEFSEALVLDHLEAADAQAVIEALAGCLHQAGLVNADYGARTWEREQEHPTGLPTRPFCIAFPHADAEGVITSALGVARLAQPVFFKNMADPDEDLEVHLVLMLANRSPEEQIQTLRNLATLFGEPEHLAALREQPTARELWAWLRRELRLD
jgi:PTS system galactitol-specific IIA component